MSKVLNSVSEIYADKNILKSIELEDGRVLRYFEGMPSIDKIIDTVTSDIQRFTNELSSPYCTFDRKEELKGYIEDFKMAVNGWEKLKEEM